MFRYLCLLCCLSLCAWGCTVRRVTKTPASQSAPAGQPAPSQSRPQPRSNPAAPAAAGSAAAQSAPYSGATLVDAGGTMHPVQAVEADGGQPWPCTFGADQTAHVKIVKVFPAQGEMLIVPLPALRGEFCYPGPGAVISNYGMRGRSMHSGVDIKARPGDTLRAALGGVVRMSKWYADYGNIVVIRHPNGLETLYGHNTRNLVSVNDCVAAGQAIALAGRTGRATTEHLHFEVRVAGRAIDPSLLVDHAARSVQDDTLYLYNNGTAVLALRNANAGDYFAGTKAGLPAVMADAGKSYSGFVASVRTAQPAPASAARVPATVPGAADSGDYRYHTVAKGDTLYAISRRYGVKVDRICSLNNLSDPGKLSIGQKLKIPAK